MYSQYEWSAGTNWSLAVYRTVTARPSIGPLHVQPVGELAEGASRTSSPLSVLARDVLQRLLDGVM
ncbi:hypothetical protein SGLAM104S_08995 [Streptomyces glaucescens]